MSKIVIKKRVSLEFLGEEYKEAYLLFKAIPLADYKEFTKSLPQVSSEFTELIKKIDSKEATEEDEQRFIELQKENSEINDKSYDLILGTLKKYFIGGEFPDENGTLQKLTKEDANEMDSIDRETATSCFQTLTAEKSDPKA